MKKIQTKKQQTQQMHPKLPHDGSMADGFGMADDAPGDAVDAPGGDAVDAPGGDAVDAPGGVDASGADVLDDGGAGDGLDESSWMASKTVGFRSFRMGFDACFFTLGFGSWDVTMRSMVSSMGPAGPRRINAMDFVKA